MLKSEDYRKGYQAGYQAGKRKSKPYVKDIDSCGVKDISKINPISSWFGEADGYADGELVYDRWFCGACGHYFEEWEEEPTWNFCPVCGEPMTEKGRQIRGEKHDEQRPGNLS